MRCRAEVWLGALLVWLCASCAPVEEMGLVMGGLPAARDSVSVAGPQPAPAAIVPAARVPSAEADSVAAMVDSSAALAQTLLLLPLQDLTKYKGPWDIYSEVARGLGDSLERYEFFRVVPVDSALVRLSGKQLRGRIPPETGLRLGRELGADFVVLGEIEDLSMKRQRATMPIGGYRSYQGVASITLVLLKVIDGREAGEVKGDGKTDEKQYGITNPAAYVPYEKEYLLLGTVEWGSAEFHETLLGQATGLCLQKLAAGLADLVRPPPDLTIADAILVEVDGLQAYINVGIADGVQNGHKFGVWDRGHELSDPGTGVFLGQALPRRVGVVQVEQVLAEHLSLVRVMEGGASIQKGYQIRAE